MIEKIKKVLYKYVPALKPGFKVRKIGGGGIVDGNKLYANNGYYDLTIGSYNVSIKLNGYEVASVQIQIKDEAQLAGVLTKNGQKELIRSIKGDVMVEFINSQVLGKTDKKVVAIKDQIIVWLIQAGNYDGFVDQYLSVDLSRNTK